MNKFAAVGALLGLLGLLWEGLQYFESRAYDAQYQALGHCSASLSTARCRNGNVYVDQKWFARHTGRGGYYIEYWLLLHDSASTYRLSLPYRALPVWSDISVGDAIEAT